MASHMSGKQHSYGLDWLDEDVLFEVTKKTFEKALAPSGKKPLPPDPFTLLAQAVIAQRPLEDAIAFESERRVNKTLSNQVGMWHQHVLGLAGAWEDLGSAGGGVDLRMKEAHPRFGKPVIAEVKNRFNTIKASDEATLWDKLDLLARSGNAVAYVFQIVPKDGQRYDCPWNVSGRDPRERVRCCDGVTAYELVFGREGALEEIYRALPFVLSDITGKPVLVEEDESTSLFYQSFPANAQ